MSGRTIAAAVAALLAGAAGARTLPAQGAAPACADQGLAQDACQKAADLFAFMTPQIGAAIAGGNATMGQGGHLGGFGRFALGVRATGLRGALPDVESVAVRPGAAAADEFAVSEQWVALPQVDLGIGIFKGFPTAISNVGGLDLLLSGSWVPELEEGDFSLRAPGGQFRVGYGVRLGILQESFTSPGVSLTYLRRGLPTLDLTARPGDDTLAVTGARVTVDSWRLVASRNMFALGLAAGIGQDRYDAEASLLAVVRESGVRVQAATSTPFSQELTRTNAFASLSLNISAARLVGEVGRSWGGSVATVNGFEGTTPTEPRLYGSLGLRVGW